MDEQSENSLTSRMFLGKRFLMCERIKIHIEPRYVKEEDWNGRKIRPFQREALEAIKRPDTRIIFIEVPVRSGKSYIIRIT